MHRHQRAAELRRRVAYLAAAHSADEALTPQSERLRDWRAELEAQGFVADEVNDVFLDEERWLKKSGRTPDDLLMELASELPQAQQREEEHHIEVVRRATGESYWGIPMALAWIRFRDVEHCCRHLGRRDALHSLWRGDDIVETDELEQRLASGEATSSGLRGGDFREISSAEWTRGGHEGLRFMIKDGVLCAGHPGEPVSYTQLRFARQKLQHAFPGLDDLATTDGPPLAAARIYLRQSEGEEKWDVVWEEVLKSLGQKVSNNRRERLQIQLWKEFPDKLLRGAPKKKLPRQKRSPA